jgi:hypothetical protein
MIRMSEHVDRRGCGTTVFSSMRIIKSSISQLNFLGLLCSLDTADVQKESIQLQDDGNQSNWCQLKSDQAEWSNLKHQ